VITTLEDICRSLGIKCEIFLPENIYTGELTSLAPDILFILDGLTTSINRRFTKLHKGFFIKDSPPSNHTGEHRMNGIFLASGPDFKSGSKIDGATLFDIAPTILHMFDVPIPNDMDGRILTEIFSDDSEIAQRTPIVVNPTYYDKKLEGEKLKSIIKKLKI
jgi:predicted AlkP superfamily phosphohydrolase/phosphomutase